MRPSDRPGIQAGARGFDACERSCPATGRMPARAVVAAHPSQSVPPPRPAPLPARGPCTVPWWATEVVTTPNGEVRDRAR